MGSNTLFVLAVLSLVDELVFSLGDALVFSFGDALLFLPAVVKDADEPNLDCYLKSKPNGNRNYYRVINFFQTSIKST